MSVPAQVPISGPYIANGSTTQFAYKFYLLFVTDMQVFVGGTKKTLNTHYTVTGVGNSHGGNVVFTTAPDKGLEVLIKRATPYTRQTDYADNGDLLADVVNDDFDRVWLALQEINANFSSSISKAVGGNWDAQSLRITAVADGNQPQDVATVNQLNVVNDSAGQSAQAAANSATAAKASENNAASIQQAAASSASAASVSAGNSSDSANLAQKWAANPVGSEVTHGKYSAFNYASKASDSATDSSTSATKSSTSANYSAKSAEAAANSAASAKSDADRAQTANPDNQLKKANNLSDVDDKSTAWINIAQFGSTAGTAAQGNDSRLTTVNDKSGGTITSGITVKGGVNTSGGGIFVDGKASDYSGNVSNSIALDAADANYIGYIQYFLQKDSYHSLRFMQNNIATFTARSNGACYAASFNPTSDARLKLNKEKISDALEKVLTLSGYTFDLFGERKTGGLAQEIQKVLPEVVTETFIDHELPDGTQVKNGLAVDYGATFGLMVEAVKELNCKVEQRDALIDEILKRLKPLDGKDA